jgi:hypothetical protein
VLIFNIWDGLTNLYGLAHLQFLTQHLIVLSTESLRSVDAVVIVDNLFLYYLHTTILRSIDYNNYSF